MVSPDSVRVSRVPTYLGYFTAYNQFRLRGFHPLCRTFPDPSAIDWSCRRRSPATPVSKPTGLASSAFARHYLRNHCYFLLLWVLRCFSSPRSPPFRDDRPSACRVAPFGYPGIKGYLRLPRAFRSLSRPSSPPRAKASTVCPCLLSLTSHLTHGLIYLKLALLVSSF